MDVVIDFKFKGSQESEGERGRSRRALYLSEPPPNTNFYGASRSRFWGTPEMCRAETAETADPMPLKES